MTNEETFRIQDIEKKVAEIRKQRSRDRLNELLKPCPFCGGKGRIRDITESDGRLSYKVLCVSCENCGAQTVQRISDGYYDCYCSDEEIANLWNQRV